MSQFKFVSIWICIACIIFFIFQTIFQGFTDLFVLSKLQYYEVWRFISSIFLHGSLIHLMYNLFALALFGSILEGIIGYKRFIFLFFLSGIIANIFSIFFYDSSLGASGAIFGIIGVLVVLRPNLTVWTFGLPMPMFLAAIVWICGDLLGAVAFLSGNPMNNTGNIAHLGGIFIGAIYGFILRDKFVERNLPKERVYLDESGIKRWEDTFIR